MTPQHASSPLGPASLRPRLGIVGLGAFGRLAAEHLRAHFELCAFDPAVSVGPSPEPGAAMVDLATVARCPIIVLAVPVSRLEETVDALAPLLRPDTLVLDVGSVKSEPGRVMRERLPADVEVVATHPLFGPQSAKPGIAGLKVAVCPLRGSSGPRVAAFLRQVLKLRVILTTPEAHDREAALAQGLTHLIARVLVQMEPLPSRITTRSFDLLREAVDMVRHDAPDVFHAIERANPFAPEVRRRFVALVTALDAELGPGPRPGPGGESGEWLGSRSSARRS